MADEKKDAKQKAGAEDKPKTSRSAGTRKASTSGRKPARAKAKREESAETRETPAAKPRRTTARRRTSARAKEQEAAKGETKPTAETVEGSSDAEAKAPARRRAARPAPQERAADRPAPVPPVVTARAKYVRSSARKARLVIDHVRGKPIDEARALLRHSPRGVARDLERLLESAIANAENNHDLVGDDLYVKEIYADEGPTLKRFRARAQGRAYRIRKRTSHLTVALTPKE
jgi:ribosomal protein L22